MAAKKQKASPAKKKAAEKVAAKTSQKATSAPAKEKPAAGANPQAKPVPSVANARPLSPHLGIYRWQISMTLSILHRITGAFLVLGTLALSIWLLAAAHGQESYDFVMIGFRSIPGQLLLLGWLAAFYYHLLNGVRHLFWDVGKGFELKTMELTGYTVVLGTALLTFVTWLKALM
ncbi:MAG: succinate dehydrogenase, cytochrome b556 subunit [Proteobacteria bacterium]|nr:succinate dehydrogenase, cytochrome b556 subunit [Pseudomonadota bacterium]